VRLPLLPAVRPMSRYSEAIRSLRSGVQMSDVDHPPKVIQISSTLPSEGKSTLALSFATSAANSGLNVLFVDADLRHPSSSNFIGREKEKGLVDILVGDVNPKDVIRMFEPGRFWALPAGSKSQNPPDLLGSDRMRTLVANFAKSFDLVIIDTPPAGPVVDPIVVSQIADKVLFVVRWAATAREMVEHTARQFGGHTKVAGVAFNMVNENTAQKYGKYAYSYYYGSRYYGRYYTD
jgi:capsular exopolysaccharide synthesis family protein